jgi:shikimate dehydrogenase
MRVLLLGHPVAHSLSPVIQNAAFVASGLPLQYEAVDVDSERLTAALLDLRAHDCLGANVTVPYKLAVASTLDDIDADAQMTGAVNTIVNTGGVLSGYNTDIDGAWLGLLEPVLGSIRGGRVMLAGAGGGARAVIVALARTVPGGPDDVAVVARNLEEAEKVAVIAHSLDLPARAVPWWDLGETLRLADVAINCTPLGLDGEDPFEGLPLTGGVVLDLAYRPGGTRLFQRAWEEGAMAIQGDQMLLQQGAEAFRLWTGQDAPISVMRKALEQALA